MNSLDGKVFYVGKGRGRRMFVHEHRAKRNHIESHENRHLRNKILSIWRNGGVIQYKQTFFTDDDMEAYRRETERIKEIGIHNLCNVFISPPTPEELYRLRSFQMRGRILPEETKRKISNTLMGHPVSAAARKKIGDSCRGKSNPCTESKRISIANSRKPPGGFPNMVSPLGEIVSINILTDFCKTHGIGVSHMSDLLHGRAKSCKGWRVHIPEGNAVWGYIYRKGQ